MIKIIIKYITILMIILMFSSSTNIFAGENVEYMYGVNNLLLIGADKKSAAPYNFLIVLTIDSINKKLTLTSLNTDSVIDFNNTTIYDLYLNNGEDYLINEINNNYNIRIDNYVVINKIALSKIVDSTGTIKLNHEVVCGDDIINHLEKNRHLGLLDLQKIQRDVIQELLYGFSKLPFSRYPYLISETFKYVKVSMTPFKMLCLGFTALSLNNYKAIQVQLY